MRLILIETPGENDDLVDLDTRAVLVSAINMWPATLGSVPIVTLGWKEQNEINGKEDAGRPGWDAIFDWLNKKFPAGSEQKISQIADPGGKLCGTHRSE